MKWRRPRRAGAAAFAALVAATAFTHPASGSDVTGKSGTDTSLKVTDSKLTVSGRGRFADVRITVNQTKNLVNQAISVTWSGAAPTRTSPGRFGANYMQLMQCWGDDDGANSDNPGPPPSQCVFGASNAVYGGLSSGLFPDGSFTTDRVISTEGWENFEPNGGTYDERTRWLWQPFRSVDGTEIGVHTDPTYNPERPFDDEGNPKSWWLNPKFNILTTNEIAAGRTGKNGTGGELFEVMTGIESSGLGCGQAVESVSGGKRIPKCWLVVVPRGVPADENAGTPSAERADEFGVMTSPLAPNSWKNRIAVPLEFTPVDSNCSLADDQRRIAGTELIAPAVSSWQLKLCATPARRPYTYVPIPDSSARQQLMNPAPGSPGMVVVSRPVAQESLDPDNPVTYAPVSLSGIVIGFNVERFTHPAADSEAQQISGVRVAELNLTPRLLAKLLTQSYRSQVEIKALPSPYEWVKSNPAHLATDKDFLQFNPEFAELLIQSGKNFGGLVLPVGNSDLAHQVWEYILADPEAKAWLDGQPDPFGMKVNPLYATTAAANRSGEAFGDPTPRSFPKSDPYCYEGSPVGPNHDVVPLPLCGTDWLPYARSLREDARITRLADDGAKIIENLSATSPDQVYKRDLPQPLGSRAMLSLTDTASAFRYGIQTARLSRAGDNGSGRKFIAADGDGLSAGLAGMKPGSEPAVIEPDPKAAAPDGYPLTALTYAAIRPLALDETARQEYADFVAFGGGDGQVPGFGDGKLPEGYAPLPDTLKTQALHAAKTIRELTPAALALSDTTNGGASVGSGDDAAFDAGSGFDSFGLGESSGGSLSLADPATIASPSKSSSLGSRIKRFLTPAVSTPATRFVLPFLAALALAAGFGAAEISRRLGRRDPVS